MIPTIHPGFDARGSQSVVQRRLYLLTYILIWTYADTAMETVSCAAGSLGRQDLCEQIMERADIRLMDAGFWSVFDKAKSEMRETWRVLRLNDLRVKKVSNSSITDMSQIASAYCE